MTNNWTKQFPNKAGFYFFYGYVNGNKDFAPQLRTVECMGTNMDYLLCISNGSVFDPRDNHIGSFLEIPKPKLPKLES